MRQGIPVIIVVDRDGSNFKLLKDFLTERFLVFRANTIDETLEILGKNKTDLVITDIYIKKSNGFELIKKMRSRGFNSKIIILSSHKKAEPKNSTGALLPLGVGYFLVKSNKDIGEITSFILKEMSKIV